MLVLLGNTAAAETIEPDWENLRQEFERDLKREMRRERLVGLSLAVVHKDQIVWVQGYGESNRQARSPATADTRYEIGDISKAVTTLAALRLVERGKLDLDADIRTYLPDLVIESRVPNPGPVTVRRLLTHHGGVVSNRWQGSYQTEASLGLPKIDRIFLSQLPGSIYSYSGFGYQIVGAVIEAVANENFTEYVAREVLQPLGMTSASYATSGRANSYEKRKLIEPSYPRDLASIGLHASANDLARLAVAMINPNLSTFSSASIQEIRRHQNADIPLDIDNKTGLAWQLTNAGNYRAKSIMRINNAGFGYSGLLLIAPEEEIAVAVLSNAGDGFQSTTEIGQDLFDAVLEAVTGREPPNRDDFELVPAAMPSSATPAVMSASYVTALGIVSLQRDGPDRYDARFLGRNFRAIEQPSGWYRLKYRLLGVLSLSPGILDEVMVRPAKIEGQDVLILQFRENVFVFGAKRDPAPVSDRYAQLAGNYRLLNPDWLSKKLEIDKIQISAGQDGLTASYRLPFFFKLEPQLPLVPFDENRLVIPGLGSNLGEPVTILSFGESATLEYSGYRFTRD